MMSLVLSTSACTTTKPLTAHHYQDSLYNDLHKKVKNTQNNTYIKDSTYIRERGGSPHPSAYASPWRGGEGIGCCDTITIEHWHTEVRDSVVEIHDTMVNIVKIVGHDSIPYPVEVPVEVEKPVPRFYIHCTIGFFMFILVLLTSIVIRTRTRL